MTQNLLSRKITDDELTRLDSALNMLEKLFEGFPEFAAEEIRGLDKMGDRSEPFCRQTLMVLAQNTQVLPPSFNLAEAQNDLANLDALRPRFHRLRQLMSKADGAETAFGSDLKNAAGEGYALLKVSGKGAALEALREAMSARRGRKSGKTPPEKAG